MRGGGRARGAGKTSKLKTQPHTQVCVHARTSSVRTVLVCSMGKARRKAKWISARSSFPSTSPSGIGSLPVGSREAAKSRASPSTASYRLRSTISLSGRDGARGLPAGSAAAAPLGGNRDRSGSGGGSKLSKVTGCPDLSSSVTTKSCALP